MKNFLISLGIAIVVSLLFGFFLQLVGEWINSIRFRRARKKAAHSDKWIYEMWDKEEKK